MSFKHGGLDLELVIGGQVALTPASNFHQSTQRVELQEEVYNNGDTEVEEQFKPMLTEEDIDELAFSNPELYEEIMKNEGDT